jgi:hypothetical protein
MDQIKDHPLYRKHNIDSAMSALWEFYKTRFVALYLISLVMSAVIQYASLTIDLQEIQAITDPAVMLEKLKGFLVPMMIVMLVSLFFSTIFHYYILHKPLDESQNIFRCTLKSLKYFLPYLIIFVILVFAGSVAMLLGLMVLIVGVFFSIVYIGMVALFIMPVMMVEETSIDRTIARTVRLAHTGFWSNMGWTAVFIILYIIISLVLSGLVLLPFAGNFLKTFANPEDTTSIMNLSASPLFLVLSTAINALTLPLLPIFAFILYFNGKAREENINLPITGNDPGNKVRVEDLYAKPREENLDTLNNQ